VQSSLWTQELNFERACEILGDNFIKYVMNTMIEVTGLMK